MMKVGEHGRGSLGGARERDRLKSGTTGGEGELKRRRRGDHRRTAVGIRGREWREAKAWCGPLQQTR